jgi:hypothetical protein
MRAKTDLEIAEELDHDAEHESDIAALQSLLTHGKIEQARSLVSELVVRWPDSDLMRRFARVLAPPVARVVEGRKGITRAQSQKESAWLRENAGRYPGCWVILDGDRLLAAHPRLRTAIEEADRQVGRDVGSLHYVPAHDSQP